MKTTTLKNKKLETFLKEQGCYKKFMKNLNDHNVNGIGNKINFRNIDECDLITCAFIWEVNFHFWYTLNSKWCIYLQK